MSGMKWIKIDTGIFNNTKIQLIKSMPEGNTLIVIWFQILALAGREFQNGVFVIHDKLPCSDEMLATIFGENLNTVRLALKTFEEFGMIETCNGCVTVSNWNAYQSVDKYENQKQKTKERVKKFREKQRLLEETPEIKPSKEKCNVTVTLCNALELEEEIDKEKDIYSSCCNSTKQRKVKDGHSAVSDFYTKNIRPTPSEYELNCLLELADDYSDEWTIEALKETIKGGGRGLRYTEKILERWKVEGYKSRPAGKKRSGPSTQSQETIDQANEIPF